MKTGKRSWQAAVCEKVLWLSGGKKVFSDPRTYEKHMRKRSEEEKHAFKLPRSIRSKYHPDTVSFQGMPVLAFRGSDQQNDDVVLLIHGGAYVNEITNNHLTFCGKLAQKSGITVLAPIYPLAPNHRCRESFQLLTDWYLDVLRSYRGKISMIGDSAGGGLAFALCQYFSKNSIRLPDELIGFSPWVDITMQNPDIPAFENLDPMLSAPGLADMGKVWADNIPVTNYMVSPIFGDVSVFQNVTLFVGTREIFYPDVTKFFEKLQQNNVKADLHIGEGMNHDYPLYPIPEAADVLETVCTVCARSVS
ncbi:MAG TPA: alpha/beta hydrolase [Limnochordia bacterium]|jgi:acetyl esterase/lipase|nr:alpha/beta hydrolase [Limnochordia bacterium]